MHGGRNAVIIIINIIVVSRGELAKVVAAPGGL
jgi:hypothetical protein